MNPMLINEVVNSDLAKDAQRNVKTVQKVVLIGGGVALIFLIGRHLYKKYKAAKEAAETVDDAKKDIIPKDVSLPESWFSQSADLIQQALTEGALNPFAGPDKLSVYLILQKLKSKSDWLKLVSKFGLRKDRTSGIWENSSMIIWLRYFIDDQDGIKYIRNILSKLDVTY